MQKRKFGLREDGERYTTGSFTTRSLHRTVKSGDEVVCNVTHVEEMNIKKVKLSL
jgi:hypothetical protein